MANGKSKGGRKLAFMIPGPRALAMSDEELEALADRAREIAEEDDADVGTPSRTVLISIRPQFVEKIFSGEKEYEFRRRFPNFTSEFSALVYESRGRHAVVGALKIDTVVEGSVEELESYAAPKDRPSLRAYIGDHARGFALHIREASRLNSEISLEELRRFVTPPVAWCYAPEGLVQLARRRGAKL